MGKKKSKKSYERLGTVPIEEVMKMKESDIGTFFDTEVRICSSKRIRTFIEKGMTCSCCGKSASFFAIERHTSRDDKHSGRYHLNLYGVDEQGNEVLFTHDHTLARALGGDNILSNMTTMCSPCNFKKSISERVIIEEKRKQ